MKRFFWSTVHNLIAHPLLVIGAIIEVVAVALCFLTECAERFHDWTAEKM